MTLIFTSCFGFGVEGTEALVRFLATGPSLSTSSICFNALLLMIDISMFVWIERNLISHCSTITLEAFNSAGV